MLHLCFAASLALVQDSAAPLELTLARTRAALDHLGEIEQALRQRDPSAIALALASTEAPLETPSGDPRWRDERLDELRREIVQLQGELERDVASSRDEARPLLSLPAASAPPTLGLDDATRAALASSAAAQPAPGASNAAPAADAKTAFEPEGYAADSLRLGHALYRRRDFERALATFSQRSGDADAEYWRARCLEQLGRLDESIEALEALAAKEASSWIGARAKEDLDYLRWHAAFARKAAPRPERTP